MWTFLQEKDTREEWGPASVAAQALGESRWGHSRGYSAQGRMSEKYTPMFRLRGDLGRKDRKSQASQVTGYTPEKEEWGRCDG